jgi:hypothetical protein
LTVLVESSARRCPSCHSRLRRRRKQPIVLGVVDAREPEPVAIGEIVEPTFVPAPQPEPVATAASRADLDDALDGDVNSIVDALHRKARRVAGEPVEPPQVPRFDEPVVDRSARPLRLIAPVADNRRRWSRRDG